MSALKASVLEYGNTNKNDQELVIEVTFDTTPKSFWEVRSLKPFKTVKTEYWIMSGLSFVGNVGGTLGMFVGFSFIGVAELFIGTAAALWQRLKRKHIVNFKRSISIFRKSLWSLLCLCFLGGSISFVWPTINEYNDGATSYTERHEPVTLEDIPTIVICFSFEDDYRYSFTTELFPMNYGRDVVIYATIFEEENKTVALLKDQHVQTILGLNIKLSELVLSRKPKWQCYKITTWGTEKVSADIQNLGMKLSFSFPTANESTFHFSKKYGNNNTWKTGNNFNSNFI